MRGRKPKDPDVRRRRNKASSAATLDADPIVERKPPTLSSRLFGGSQPHYLTKQWWKAIWRSPMASRWLESDVEGLYLVAILRDKFFREPTSGLAAEIRQQESRFGLDVLSRRRLDWRISGPQPAAPESEEEPAQPAASPFPDDFDPRDVLRAVK